MPIHATTAADGRPGFQWGRHGKIYAYSRHSAHSRRRALRKAHRQASAARAAGFREHFIAADGVFSFAYRPAPDTAGDAATGSLFVTLESLAGPCWEYPDTPVAAYHRLSEAASCSRRAALVREFMRERGTRRRPFEGEPSMPAAVADRDLLEEAREGQLIEATTCAGGSLAVDRAAGLIRGVKVLGLVSANNRRYTPECLRAAARLYEGKQVNVDHAGADGRRSYRDRNGVLQNVSLREGEGLFADYRYNPHHPITEQLLWDAENAPGNVGFSHDVRGLYRPTGNGDLVEQISLVRSVDLVANPATSATLFEDRAGPGEPPMPAAIDWKALTLAELREHRADLVDAVVADLEGRDLLEAKDAELKTLRDKLAAVEAEHAKRVADLTEELNIFREEKRKIELEAQILAELREAKLDPADKSRVSDVFLATLRESKDAATRKEHIKDRLRMIESIVGPRKPSPFSSSRYAGGEGGEGTPADRAAAWRN